jgi:RHS repeat-associated protein
MVANARIQWPFSTTKEDKIMKSPRRDSSLSLHSLLRKFLILAGFALCPAYAQDTEPYQQQANLIKAPEAALKLGTDLFGDQINLYTGSVSFQHTDVSLRGNNALDVSIGRRLAVGTRVVGGHQFGRWELDIPHIHGTYSAHDGWITRQGDTRRCTGFSAPPITIGNGSSYWGPIDYWSGIFLSLPSGEEQRMLLRASNFPNGPGDPARYPIVTKDHWTFECLPTLANNSAAAQGEGFVALSPEGTRYTFNWLATYPASVVISHDSQSKYGSLDRADVWLLPTLVTDRFGNTVRYTYDPARPGNMTKIEASDGRMLTLSYGAAGEDRSIKSVSDGTRTWNYSYSVDGQWSDLDTVTLPDNSAWKVAGLRTLLSNVYVNDVGVCGNPIDVVETVLTGSIQHPSGASASYRIAPVLHGRTDVPLVCSSPNHLSYQIPLKFYTNSLTSRTISGPGLVDMTWTYEYASHGTWAPCGQLCDLGKTVLQHDPAGNTTRYTFGNRFEVSEGMLMRVDYGWDGTSAVRTVTNQYKSPIGAPYPETYGTSTDFAMGDIGTSMRNRPLEQRVTTQQGVNFTWHADAFDVFMRPTQVTRSSSLGMSKTETTAYFDHAGKWVLGQVQSVTEASTGRVPVANSYNPDSANLETTTSFGKLQSTLAYNVDGTLSSHKDGRGLLTVYNNYKRGIPQQTTYADGTGQSAVVNDIGTVASTMDATGATTSYGYDAIGRLASVTYPGADSVAWNPTVIQNEFIGWQEHDIGAGHWRQVVSSGNAYRRTFFDALWRPVYTEAWDAADVAGTMRVTKHQYDFDSRPTFESYPKRSVAELTQGVYHAYDALGRPTITSTDSELGMLYSGFVYIDGFATVHSSARQLYTTFHYQAFDEPVDNAIVSIRAPEGVSVDIARDIFGKPTSITRSGGGKSAMRNYVYDAYQRLCKTIEPETGATVQDYDAANNTAWRASGLALPSTSTCDTASVPAAKRMTFDYDRQNRLTKTTFGDASPSIGRTYTPDGLPETITTNGSVWTNTYNKRRLNERESLVYGGMTYNIDRSYDTNASLQQLKYPVDNLTLAYNPNALGEPRQVGTYASAITYHPSGAIASFKYGNGIVHSMAQNLRALPSRSTDGAVLDDLYTYDQNTNVTGIADQIVGSVNSRTMVYDDLDRLTSAAAPNLWGTATYAYDSLDNLTASTISAGGTARTSVHDIDPATNRLTMISSGPGAYSFAYQYDSQGNIVRRGAQAYVFDQGNRMTSAPGKATYAYDGLGHRFSVVGKDGVNRLQVYSQEGQLLYAGPTNSTGTKYVYLHKHVIAEVDGNGAKYSHTDGLGSPVVQTDTSGGIVSRTRYEPYGLVAAGTPTTIGFTGHVNDIDTGLIYMQQRYYDPVAGRMLSTDPVMTDASSGSSFNRYAYGNDSPYRYTDPDGRSALDIGFLAFDVVKFGLAAYSGVGVGAAAADVGLSLLGVASPIPGTGQFLKGLRGAEHIAVAIKNAEKVAEVAKVAKNGETAATKAGREAHKAWEAGKGFKKEVRLPSGKQADAVNFAEKEVKELKPNNARAIQRGEKQVEGYREELQNVYGGEWTKKVETY